VKLGLPSMRFGCGYCRGVAVRTPVGALALSVMWLLPSVRMIEPVPL
jgi:hypothetical protein